MSNKKVALGVIVGIAIGAVVGVLFAPDKGSETRKKISKKADDLKDKAGTKFDDLVNSINELFDSAKKEGRNGETKEDATNRTA